MKILIIEDEDSKFEAVKGEVEQRFSPTHVAIQRVDCLAAATKAIYEMPFDLIIMDLMLPDRHLGEPRDASEELLGIKLDSDHNRSTPCIALTRFDDLVDQQLRKFNEANIVLVLYDEDGCAWKKSLSLEVANFKDRHRFDFVIVCALEKERQAYRGTKCHFGDPVNQSGIDCVHAQIGSYRGVIAKPSRMGPIEAAITVSRCIEKFRPRVVAMSGICAGFSDEVSLGTLLIPEICWDYQTGKWTDDGFITEPYAVSIPARVRSEIATFVAGEHEKTLRDGFFCEQIDRSTAKMGVLVTGSSVISSVQKMDEIGAQHRKLSGLDMEMTSVFQAAASADYSLQYFGAKTVVDLGDKQKNDSLHGPGSVYSARFVVNMIEILFR